MNLLRWYFPIGKIEQQKQIRLAKRSWNWNCLKLWTWCDKLCTPCATRDCPAWRRNAQFAPHRGDICAGQSVESKRNRPWPWDEWWSMITFHQPICWVIFGPRIPKHFNYRNVGVSMVRHVIFFTVCPLWICKAAPAWWPGWMFYSDSWFFTSQNCGEKHLLSWVSTTSNSFFKQIGLWR